MSTNAPYYARQFSDASHTASPLQPQIIPGGESFAVLSPATVSSSPPLASHSPPCFQRPASQPSAERALQETHTFQNLLQAAHTAAAGQPMCDMNTEQGDPATPAVPSRPKRMRTSKSPSTSEIVARRPSGPKRRRVDVPTDPQLQTDVEAAHALAAQPSNETLLDNARAAGVHSAAALFRRTSDKTSRKYTRPPMSKLFMSLQLTPEHFLQLQSQAKAYMLDSAHPERQNCVGSRGKGDTDMVKLRLFNCVHDFLSNGVGEQFFGEHVEKPGYSEAYDAARALGEENVPIPEDRLTWPRDGNKIISLVTPLMRRMVTNERQRQYAVETRKGGSKKKDVDVGVDHGSPSENPFTITRPGSPTFVHLRHVATSGPSTLPLNPATSKLPTSHSPTPHLSRINIFLTFTPQPSKPPIKLDETRILPTAACLELAWYDWSEFQSQVKRLVSEAKAKYSELQPQLHNSGSGTGSGSNSRNPSPTTTKNKNDSTSAGPYPSTSPHDTNPTTTTQEPQNLHSLAIALNTVSHIPHPHHHQLMDTSDDQPQPQHTPRETNNEEIEKGKGKAEPYTVKSLCSTGWKEIASEQDWYGVLREKAFAIWADGVCNVVVEMNHFGGGGGGEGGRVEE